MQNIFLFIAGLGLFLMSFQLIVKHMQNLMGNKISKTIKNVGNSKIRAMTFGAGCTTILQNSTAVMVLVISFTELGILSILQSIPLVLGVNIGASLSLLTILLSSFKVSVYITALSIVGAFLVAFGKREKMKDVGYLLFAIGILFLGMNLMTSSMSFLSTMPEVETFIANITNPIVLILIGLVLGTIIQSSLASNAILITICTAGLGTDFGLANALWLSFSFKLGPTFMSVLASFGGNKSSKAVAFLHFFINLFILFVFALSSLTGWHTWLADKITNPALFIVISNILICTISVLILSVFAKQIDCILGKIFKDKQCKFKDFAIDASAYNFSDVIIEHLNKQAQILQSKFVDIFQSLNQAFFDSQKPSKLLNADLRDFVQMKDLFARNVSGINSELNINQSKRVQYFQNLVSRYTSMIHRYEKLQALIRSTNHGEIFDENQKHIIKKLFENIEKLANMSLEILQCYLSTSQDKCLYLSNVLEIDNQIYKIKLDVKNEILSGYKADDVAMQNIEQFARVINEAEQIGEHLTSIELNML